MEQHLVSYYIGIAIIFITHIYLLANGAMKLHSLINLVGALCIAYYFMHKEGYISY